MASAAGGVPSLLRPGPRTVFSVRPRPPCEGLAGQDGAPARCDPTRLETRTKESNMCASTRVPTNPSAEITQGSGDPHPFEGGAHPGQRVVAFARCLAGALMLGPERW